MAMLFLLQLTHTASCVCVICKINNIVKKVDFSNSGDNWIEFGSFDGGDDGEFIGGGFVAIS